MFTKGSIRVAWVVAAGLVLSACGTLDGDSRLRAPNYASPVGTNAWEVRCGVNTVYVEHNRMEQFYKDDGSRKSYTEFCGEVNDAGIKSRNRR